MTVELGSPESGSQSQVSLGGVLGALPAIAIACMVLVCVLFVLLPTGREFTVRYEEARLANVSAAKLRFVPFTRGHQWLLTLAYLVNPWASDQAVVGDLVSTGAIQESPELAGMVGQQISQKALYLAKQIPGAPPGEYEAVWYGDLKTGELGRPIDLGSRESIASFLRDFGASVVIFPIATTPLREREFDRVISWGQQIRYSSPAEPSNSGNLRSPT